MHLSRIKNIMGKMKDKAITKLNKEQATSSEKKKITVDDCKMFMHCKHCIEDFYAGKFGKGEAPKDAITYCIGSVAFEYSKEVGANIVAVFCNRCGRPVWDSRHLTHYY